MAKVVRAAKWFSDSYRDTIADPAHAAFAQDDVAAADLHKRIRLHLKHQRIADLELHHSPERKLRLVKHRIDGDLRLSDFRCEMAFPDRITAEFLAHEHLQQH